MIYKIIQWFKRNACKECDYYHTEDNTCQSKKCATCGCHPYVNWFDRHFCEAYRAEMRKAIQSRIIIPGNATNGDVIKALFPKATYYNEDTSCATMKINMGELDEYVDFYIDWWNAPYKVESRVKE